jgi:uncharacterized protein YuzE
MILTHDASIDAAYIYLTDQPYEHVARNVLVDLDATGGAMIVLDFDSQGRLMGVEVPHGASLLLRPEILREAQPGPDPGPLMERLRAALQAAGEDQPGEG